MRLDPIQPDDFLRVAGNLTVPYVAVRGEPQHIANAAGTPQLQPETRKTFQLPTQQIEHQKAASDEFV